jgi:hypothetical protein
MNPLGKVEATIELSAGMPLIVDDRTEILSTAATVWHQGHGCAISLWNLAHRLGQHVPVAQACRIVGTALYEPYLVVKNGILQTVHSREQLVLPSC